MTLFDLNLRDRIFELNRFMIQGNVQELQGLFTSIIDNVFGYSENREGWGLHKLSEHQDSCLFNAVREFLSPSGHFFSCITNKLTLDMQNLKYQFPLHVISGANRPSTCANDAAGVISLNAFEYYIFSFLCYPLSAHWNMTLELRDFEHSVYIALFTDYLEYFFFVNAAYFNSLTLRIQISKSYVTTPVFQRHLVHNNFNGSDHQFGVDFVGYHPQADGALFWQTDVLLQSISSLLLSWLSPDPFGQCPGTSNLVLLNQPNGVPLAHNEMSLKPTTCHLYLVRCFLKYFYNAAFGTAYSAANCPQFSTPNQQILWNRILSYRRFLESCICGTPFQPGDSKSLSLHCNIMPRLSQLMHFCFQHWPLDLSFDVVLETWLTGIQPWRYAQTPQPKGSSSPDLTTSVVNTCEPVGGRLSSNTWSTFAVQQHSLFIAPLLLFLRRAVRMDLRVSRNAHMVYRMAKIITHPTVKTVMSAAEETLLQQNNGGIRAGYTSDADQMASIKGTGLWSSVVIEAVDCLLTLLDCTLSEIQARRSQVNDDSTLEHSGSWQRFLRHITQFFVDSNEDKEKKDLRHCEQYLNDSINMMRQFFNIPDDRSGDSPAQARPTRGSPPGFSPLRLDDSFESPLVPAGRAQVGGSRRPVHWPTATTTTTSRARRVHFGSAESQEQEHSPPPSSSSSSPLLVGEPVLRLGSWSTSQRAARSVGEHGRDERLTPLSRFQILMGEKRTDIRFSGDPEYLPAFAYECSALVEIFRALSDFINWKMRPLFLAWCSRRDGAGWAACHLLLPSESGAYREEGSGIAGDSGTLAPRVSLRWLASYPTLFGCLLFFLLCFLLLGTRSPVLVVILGCLVYACYQGARLLSIFIRETVASCRS